MNYKIFRNVISDDMVAMLLSFGLNQATPVLREGRDFDKRLGQAVGMQYAKMWRKHNTAMLPPMVKKALSKQLIANISLDGIYDHVTPDIGVDTMVNRYEVGEYVLNHIDPPTSIWDTRNLKRRANFSCMLDNNFTGGELVFDGRVIAEKLNVGDVIVFAQPIPHQVSPITSGRRIVAFGWIYDTGLDNVE